MRRLALLAASFVLSCAGPAGAVPQPDAEAAYQRGDYTTAFQLWLPLAQQGSPLAQQNIGRMYERGEGVAQDPQAAAAWYRKAAEQGAPDDGSVAAARDLDDALARVPLQANAPVTAAPVTAAPVQPAPVAVAQPVQRQLIIVPVYRSVQRPVAYPIVPHRHSPPPPVHYHHRR